LSKTIQITDSASLLSEFSRVFQHKGFESYSVRLSPIQKGKAELRIETQNQKSLLPIWPLLYPSRKLLTEVADHKQRLLLSPHLPNSLAADLRREGISHADLNGRLFLQTPGLLLDHHPTGNRYRNPESNVDVFSLKSSRIARALLANRKKVWTQEELIQRTGVSRGLVSRILKALQEEEWVQQTTKATRTEPAHYVLSQFDKLLEAWRAVDDWSDRVTIQQFSVLSSDPDEIARKVIDFAGTDEVVFTQWYAAHLRQPYTTPPVVSAYVVYRRHLDLPLGRKVSSGGNLWLMYPKDDGLFLEKQRVRDLHLVPDAQIYLDLINTGQRGPDQAEALRQWEGFAQ
jgi:DNA-binding HxlR family transcriptional regulator